jgi:plastocyanin
MPRHSSLLFALFAVTTALSGCGKAPAPRPTVTAASHTPAATETVATSQVSIDSKSFLPAIITVPVGTTVTWTNHDNVTHTVSSDPYPLNTGLSGFDSVKPIEPNQTYTFTFTRSGEWPYHDQLRPASFTGMVIVTKE